MNYNFVLFLFVFITSTGSVKPQISGCIAHNVLAVGDVLPARIRALRSKVRAGKMWRSF
jgi:hypothetical protein